MEPFTTLKSRFLSLPVNDIDTDQIIPARFLKVTDKNGLGDNLFYDWRYFSDGSVRPDFILNQKTAQNAKILVAGDNFGCGSSREHAPWALYAFGFRVIISTSFADIFKNNAMKNGLLPVTIDEKVQNHLFELFDKDQQAELFVDLQNQELDVPGHQKVHFEIDSFNKNCLLEGIDQLGFLLKTLPEIQSFEKKYPKRVNTLEIF